MAVKEYFQEVYGCDMETVRSLIEEEEDAWQQLLEQSNLFTKDPKVHTNRIERRIREMRRFETRLLSRNFIVWYTQNDVFQVHGAPIKLLERMDPDLPIERPFVVAMDTDISEINYNNTNDQELKQVRNITDALTNKELGLYFRGRRIRPIKLDFQKEFKKRLKSAGLKVDWVDGTVSDELDRVNALLLRYEECLLAAQRIDSNQLHPEGIFNQIDPEDLEAKRFFSALYGPRVSNKAAQEIVWINNYNAEHKAHQIPIPAELLIKPGATLNLLRNKYFFGQDKLEVTDRTGSQHTIPVDLFFRILGRRHDSDPKEILKLVNDLIGLDPDRKFTKIHESINTALSFDWNTDRADHARSKDIPHLEQFKDLMQLGITRIIYNIGNHPAQDRIRYTIDSKRWFWVNAADFFACVGIPWRAYKEFHKSLSENSPDTFQNLFDQMTIDGKACRVDELEIEKHPYQAQRRAKPATYEARPLLDKVTVDKRRQAIQAVMDAWGDIEALEIVTFNGTINSVGINFVNGEIIRLNPWEFFRAMLGWGFEKDDSGFKSITFRNHGHKETLTSGTIAARWRQELMQMTVGGKRLSSKTEVTLKSI
ncbi:hypothetical protein A2154_01055 [Candidatus Gottesmanbacteria bacterium RBG_16_43_7]|uniref:Uncharacterized protein n=1 Tax=Candidatus Gottesmanbacteria bacterium RBG_16_43_7 TaxID=1798373 RepID=A0A1F5Z7L7_9BACT|nr:MAG: hypothetical protein A2154_01055 [Candidatus Gottesmanbacteria bacterium RBG_16_43_7]